MQGYFNEKLETCAPHAVACCLHRGPLADATVPTRFATRSYVEIPSDNVPFNTTPAMKAPEITAAGIEALRSKKYDVRSP